VVKIYYISISTRRPKPSDVNGLLNIKMFRYGYNIIVCVKKIEGSNTFPLLTLFRCQKGVCPRMTNLGTRKMWTDTLQHKIYYLIA